MILAIDPGPRNSGAVYFDGNRVEAAMKNIQNGDLIDCIQSKGVTDVACEWIEHYGPNIHAGKDVFETCRWIGRFEQAATELGLPFHDITRREVKLHLCGNMRAKDPNVRKALVDKFGGEKAAKGRKANPGPLYGVSSHAWSALAVAVTWMETNDVG